MTFFLFVKSLFHPRHPPKEDPAERNLFAGTALAKTQMDFLAKFLSGAASSHQASTSKPVPPKSRTGVVPPSFGESAVSKATGTPTVSEPGANPMPDAGAEMLRQAAERSQEETIRENTERQFQEDAHRGQQLAQNGNYSDVPDAEHGGLPDASALNDVTPVDFNNSPTDNSSDTSASSNDTSSLNSDCGSSPCDTGSSCDTNSSCDTSSSFDNTPSSWDNGPSGNDFGGGSCGGNDPFGF
jgi:hypothetical protein